MAKIIFYKHRNFNQKINAATEFIRQNIKPLIMSYLIIVGPVSLVSSIFLGHIITGSFREIFNANPYDSASFESSMDVVTQSMLGNLVNYLMVLLGISISYAIMRLYNQKEEHESITTREVWDELKTLFFKFLGNGILILIFVIVGIMLCILPGIYLAVALSLVFAIITFENPGGTEAVNRSFQLIKGHWWNSFGLYFVTYLIVYVLALAFSVPFILISGAVATLTLESDTFTLMDNPLYYIGNIVATFVMNFGSTVVNSLFTFVIAYNYSSITELKESTQLIRDIDSLSAAGATTD